MEALFTSRDKKRNNDIVSAENFLSIAIEKFQKASMNDPNNFLNVLQYKINNLLLFCLIFFPKVGKFAV